MSWVQEEDIELPHVIKMMLVNPNAMQAVRALNQAITFGASHLTMVQEEAHVEFSF